MIKINMPERIGDAAHTVINNKIVFVTKRYDQCAGNPVNDECFGQFHSLNRRHPNFNANCRDLIVTGKNKDAIPLSYFEHSLCVWGVSGSMTNMPDFQWDGVACAGVWEPSEDTRTEANSRRLIPGSKKRINYMKSIAAVECKIYTAWCNGEVFGYIIEVYSLRKAKAEIYNKIDDYRFDEPIYVDACWEFYGMEEIDAAITEAVNTMIKTVFNESTKGVTCNNVTA